MKKGLIAVFILLFLLLLIIALRTGAYFVYFTNSTIDKQFSSTYYVISYKFFAILMLFVLAFVFSLTTSLATKFKRHLFTAILI